MVKSRYSKMDALIDKWHSEGSQDVNILSYLYYTNDLSESELVDRTENLKGNTNYSNTSNEDFISLFKSESFCSLDEKQLKHLFQELHNRYVTEKGYDVTRNVAILSDSTQKAYGYVCSGDDLMFINKHAIDRAKEVEPNKNNFNKTNIGYSLLYVLTHESQHVVQFENSLDFAMGLKQDKNTAFLSALAVIENTNAYVDDLSFALEHRLNYDYHYVEHDANYNAFKKVREMVPENERKGKAFDQYDVFSTKLALRETPSLTGSSYEFIENRIKSMEKFARYEIDFFEKNIGDCSLKEKLLNTVNEFMEIDENGNSLFREKLRKEIGEMVEVSKDAKKRIFMDKKKSKPNQPKDLIQEVIM